MPDNTEKQIKILFWNVNRRLTEISKMMNPILHQRPQIVFLLETAMGNNTLPNFRHYEKYSDKNVNQLNHGGIAAYIDKTMAPHVFDVKFNECYVSLRFDFMLYLIFIGCYI